MFSRFVERDQWHETGCITFNLPDTFFGYGDGIPFLQENVHVNKKRSFSFSKHYQTKDKHHQKQTLFYFGISLDRKLKSTV